MINVSHQHPVRRFPVRETIRTVKIVLEEESRTAMRISVVFTNDRFIQSINRRFLDHNSATDVLAFPLGHDAGAEAELFVNLDSAKRQSKQYGVSYHEEVRRLLIHGVLHVMGYRDSTRRQRMGMHRWENKYLQQLQT
ncbi:MAG: rRNA maturation RNase YbeY [Ignavibacteriales bacterium]|nr:rRNA maturation RNase YbeY [Ignavibacteriales bacterium]